MTSPLRLAPARVSARAWGWRHAGRRAWAVAGLDLSIEPGERVLLLGASGSGKSTVLAGLAGLLYGQESGEAAGSLSVDGQPPHVTRHRSGLVLQDPETQIVMSRCGDDVAFGPENYGVPPDQIWPRVAAAMDTVGFPYDLQRSTAALSGGEKQRLALAGILANRPGLLLLDEPTANLDPDGARLVRDAVERAVRLTGATLVVVDHRVGPWLPVVDRVIVLASGSGLMADGPPEQVFGRLGSELRTAGIWMPAASSALASAGSPVPAGSSAAAVPPGAPGADGVAGRSGRPDRRPAASALIEARGLRLRYPRAPVDAVVDADLVLAAGRACAVVGPNGSGKSSLALLVAGLLAPSAGRVTAADRPDRPLHRRRPASLAQVVGTVFQNPEHQFLTSTVRGELLVAPRRLGWTTQRACQRAQELLERLGLSALAEANPFTLSGGQKRRLSVATALSVAAPVLVLDEPTFGQDAVTWAALVELLSAVRDDGAALLVVSHDEDFVARVADDVRVMDGGRLS